MAQLNLYLPDEEAEQLRAEALKENVSLSRYVAMLLDRKKAAWPASFFETSCGFMQEEFAAPADPLPEAVDLPR